MTRKCVPFFRLYTYTVETPVCISDRGTDLFDEVKSYRRSLINRFYSQFNGSPKSKRKLTQHRRMFLSNFFRFMWVLCILRVNQWLYLLQWKSDSLRSGNFLPFMSLGLSQVTDTSIWSFFAWTCFRNDRMEQLQSKTLSSKRRRFSDGMFSNDRDGMWVILLEYRNL